MAYTQVEIGNKGEKLVGAFLKQKGYSTNIDTKAPGSTDIEARGSKSSLLVQVKSAVKPNEPVSISSDEERNIKSRAAKLGWEAWEARVQLDASLNQVGEIKWRKLTS